MLFFIFLLAGGSFNAQAADSHPRDEKSCLKMRDEAIEQYQAAKQLDLKFQGPEPKSALDLAAFNTTLKNANKPHQLFYDADFNHQIRQIIDQPYREHLTSGKIEDIIWLRQHSTIRDPDSMISFDRRLVIDALFAKQARCLRESLNPKTPYSACFTKENDGILADYLVFIKKLTSTFHGTLRPLDYIYLGYSFEDQCSKLPQFFAGGAVDNCPMVDMVLGDLTGRAALEGIGVGMKALSPVVSRLVQTALRDAAEEAGAKGASVTTRGLIKSYVSKFDLLETLGTAGDGAEPMEMASRSLLKLEGKVRPEIFSKAYDRALLDAPDASACQKIIVDMATQTKDMEVQFLMKGKIDSSLKAFFAKKPNDLEIDRLIQGIPKWSPSSQTYTQDQILEKVLSHVETPADYLRLAQKYAVANRTGYRMLLSSSKHFQSLGPSIAERKKLVDLIGDMNPKISK